ncbi:MAG TPA: alpha/beta hydrolase fold domain-containing protein [Gammaproteobacteria bacterium]|nr:alpha/beta hydrolase fold domain-containing protein [Gammaproteobacteria bacterium]
MPLRPGNTFRKIGDFVGIVPSEEARSESWTARGEVAAVRRSYAGCTSRLQRIVDLIEEPFVTGYYYRYPLSRWTEGRVTLLGDSAHPMHPFLAQGACQSIEDAAVLAGVLARRGESDPTGALQEYEAHRLGRTARVQTVARTHERMWHMTGLAEMARRNRQLRSTMEVDPAAETIWGWIFRYDALEQAKQPPVAPESCMRRPESRRAFRLWANLLTPADLDRGHHGMRDAYERFLRENCPAPEDAGVRAFDAGGVPCVRVRAAGSAGRPVLLHLHGGGYVVGSAAGSAGFAARLSAACGGTCIAVDYRRAPEHPYPAAVEDAVAAYRDLLEQGTDPAHVVITGESAGAGLALAATIRLRDLGLPLPAGTVAICPMADLAVTGGSVDRAAGRDPICTRAFLVQMGTAYLQTHDPKEPFASPVYAAWHDLPPLLVQAAENEALLSDAERVVAAARRDGTEAELQTWPDSVHVFPLFDFLPEAEQALHNIGEFVRARVGA